MNETWKPIVGFEKYYEVSSIGNVRSLDRWVNDRWDGKQLRPGRILKPLPNKGYFRVALYDDEKKSYKWIARLAIEAFVGPMPLPGMQVNHKDLIRTNNEFSNLEWVTPKENTHHAIRAGRASPLHNPNKNPFTNPRIAAKCTPKMVKSIRELAKVGRSQMKIAKFFGISQTQVFRIIHNERWISV